IGEQPPADEGGAGAIVDVILVLVREPAQRGQDGVRRRLPQTAEAGVSDDLGETLEVEHALEALEGVRGLLSVAASSDHLQDLEHAASALATRDALAAALALDEVHEELRDVD